MKAAKILFWLGVAVTVVELVGDVAALLGGLSGTPDILFSLSTMASAFWQGGVLVGLSKIVEALYTPTR